MYSKINILIYEFIIYGFIKYLCLFIYQNV